MSELRKSIEFSESGRYIKERIPVSMNPDRQVTRYEDVLEELTGKPVRVLLKEAWKTDDGETVVFF